MKFNLVFYLLFLLIHPTPVFTQITDIHIDSMMEYALAKFKVAGASISVVKDGKVIFQKGYGVSSDLTQNPVNETTNFQIASNTKAFTATALSILADENKIKWTDSVKKFIPEFKMYDDYVTEHFNILDLLTHRSGLETGTGNLMFFPDGSDFTIKDAILSLQYFNPTSPFRTQFGYIDLLYAVAGEVIARVSGMSYESFVQKRIIEPLQMNRTFVGFLLKDKSNLASPHIFHLHELKTIDHFNIGMGSAAGGIYSNAEDMGKWMLLWMNQGKHGEELKQRLISENNYYETLRLHTVFKNNPNPRYNTHFSGYGLGWVLSDEKGYLKVSHNGGTPGMMSTITMYPDLNLGITVLTNTQNNGIALATAMTNTIADSYLGLEDINWSDIMTNWLVQSAEMELEEIQKFWSEISHANQENINNLRITGLYIDDWFGLVEIFEKDNELWFKSSRSPQLIGRMHYYDENTFAIKWEYKILNCDAFATFSFDKEGKAQSIQMKSILHNPDFDFHHLNLKRLKN
ncbi:MAG TPA: serine hydrolase [Saprospiraceae bacterium]|nr:serine hydrolase [Saprospiraceae bacterium]